MRQHGGHILASSSPSRGTVFELYFRRHRPTEYQFPKQVEVEVEVGAEPSAEQIVLLAEDQDIPREAACRALQQQGYRVLSARNGREALEIERRHHGPIHLLVTDVLMPHVSGPELYRKLSESRPGVRAIFMSGHVGSIANADGKTPGDAWLVKPFAMSALIACVQEVLGRRSPG